MERQVSEAVRIGRRGGAGAVLNSKSEYNRCYIPRLRLEEDEEETRKREEQQKLEEKEREQLIERDHGAWEQNKTRLRDEERRSKAKAWGAIPMPTGSKRHKEGADGTTPGRRKRARTHKLLDEDWGLQKSNKLHPPAPPIPGSLPQMEAAPLVAPPETPSPPQVPPEVPPEAPPEAPPGGKPDDNSLSIERVAQGLPPMQVAPSVEHLYEGHLGEVTKVW